MPDGAGRAIFLDRDDTVIQDMVYSVDVEKLRLLPGAKSGLMRLQDAGWRLVMVTNQSGVARGIFDDHALQAFNAHMLAWLRDQGINLAGLYYCPHHIEGTVAPYARRCNCRKPEPGMLLQAARELNIDLSRSWMIGDRPADIGAGRAAGCRTIRIGISGKDEPAADFDAANLNAAADIILEDPL